MLHTTQLPLAGPVDRVVVTVTFLRMDRPAVLPAVALPAGFAVWREVLDVAGYRALYNEVGAPWMWWLRRIMPDAALARHLENPFISVYVLRREDGAPAGFFELDRGPPDVNLAYFGLLPGMIGQGLGRKLLQAAVREGFADGVKRGMTVNTCTADHKNALPNYLAAGFREKRRVEEVWDVPRRLGLKIPDHLRA